MRNRQLVSETVQSVGAIIGFCLLPFVIVLSLSALHTTKELNRLEREIRDAEQHDIAAEWVLLTMANPEWPQALETYEEDWAKLPPRKARFHLNDPGPSGVEVGLILAAVLSFSCVMSYFTSQDGLTGPK